MSYNFKEGAAITVNSDGSFVTKADKLYLINSTGPITVSDENGTVLAGRLNAGKLIFKAVSEKSIVDSLDCNVYIAIGGAGGGSAELTTEAVQEVVPMAFGEWTTPPSVRGAGSVVIGNNAVALNRACVVIGENAQQTMGWGVETVIIGHGAYGYGNQAIAIGRDAHIGANYATALGYSAGAYQEQSLAVGSLARAESGRSISVGLGSKASKTTALTIGAQFTETTDSGNVSHTCTTEGTGSITIGAGANTLNTTANDGTVTESSNSITIGCKAENKGVDSVVIGAQASGMAAGTVALGAGTNTSSAAGAVAVGNKAKVTRDNGTAVGSNANAGWHGTALGHNSSANNQNCAIGWGAQATAFHATALGVYSKALQDEAVALGPSVTANGKNAVAIGRSATVADEGAAVFRSSASDGTYTQLYFSGANTPLANTYENGEAMMGYVVRDSAGNVMVDAEGNAMVGTQKLSVLFPNNRGENAFTPAALNLDEGWTPKPMFRPSDLDMPVEEPAEPEEYTPLPVYPIVEPEIEEIME